MKRPGFGRMPSVQPGTHSPDSGAPLRRMLRARAVGGPRDGVLLEALPNWNGAVRKPTGPGNPPIQYRGRYVWDYHPETRQYRWVWQELAPLGSDGAKKPTKE